MQQYRLYKFSDVFCLNCMFVIDAAVKQLISRSVLDCGVSAGIMADWLHTKNFFLKIKSDLHYTRRSTEVW